MMIDLLSGNVSSSHLNRSTLSLYTRTFLGISTHRKRLFWTENQIQRRKKEESLGKVHDDCLFFRATRLEDA